MDEQKRRQTPSWALALIIVAFLASSLAARLVPWFLSESLGEWPILRELLVSLLALGAVGIATIGARRWWPHLCPAGFELLGRPTSRALALAGGGALGGLALLGLTYVIVRATGGVSVRYHGPSGLALVSFLGAALGVTILAAAWEELTFRGWPFLSAQARFGAHWMVWLVGLLFGLAHLFNPEWSVTSILSVTLAGAFLGYAMLAARTIAFPIGLHVGWNFGRTLLMSRTLWEVTRHGSELRSGGAGGLESSLAGVLITAAGALLLLILFVRRERRERKTLD